jgi:GT2 family glycosyltransferase
VNLSFVLASRDRSAKLQETLRRFRTLTSPGGWELVLVDDGSSDGTLSAMQGFAGSAPFPVTVVGETGRGWGCAKNAGTRAARGDIVVSIDDDCYPSEDYVERALAVFEDGEIAYMGGRILPYNPEHAPLAIRTDTERRIIPPRSFVPAGLVQGANMAFRRTVFDRLGGFDESFGAGARFSGADVEFAARASAEGLTGGYFPEPVVYHDHGRATGRAARERMRWYDRGRGAYYAKYLLRPDTRRLYAQHWWWAMNREWPGPVLREIAGASEYLCLRALRKLRPPARKKDGAERR